MDLEVVENQSILFHHQLHQELELAVENSRISHKLLSRYLALDPFPELLAEANESVTGLGRMRLHVFSELCLSVIPNFCYNTATRR